MFRMTDENNRPFRLLVVDDVADNRRLLHRFFGGRGFDIVEADGGAAALALIEQQKFDAVLLDIVMPGMDGIEVLKRIRARHASRSLPVIMVSGKTASLDFSLALKLGANDYITKPIDLSGALVRVHSHLSPAPMEQSSSRPA
jgi:CheY-like chemotaxis protein